MKHVAYKNDDWEITPDKNYVKYQGTLLKTFLQKNDYIDCFDEEMKAAFETNQTKFGEYRIENDGGRSTRANIPFMDPPSPPIYLPIQRLSNELQEKINFVRSLEDVEEAKPIIRELVQPYRDVMSNLPGGVHNCGEKTVIEMVKKLSLNPSQSVLLECGSGAPILGLETSIFTKQTICIDIDDVMKTVYSIIETMNDKSSFIKTIHLIAGYSSFDLTLTLFSIRGYPRNEANNLWKNQ